MSSWRWSPNFVSNFLQNKNGPSTPVLLRKLLLSTTTVVPDPTRMPPIRLLPCRLLLVMLQLLKRVRRPAFTNAAPPSALPPLPSNLQAGEASVQQNSAANQVP